MSLHSNDLIQPWIKQFLSTNVQPLYVLRMPRKLRISSDMTWIQIAEYANTEETLLKKLNPKLAKITRPIKSGTVVMIPGKALNVSYSEEGLQWTATKTRFHYFKNARPQTVMSGDTKFVKFVGDTNLSDQVYVERFNPRDHIVGGKINTEDQVSEYLWVDKALRLMYLPTYYENIHTNYSVVEDDEEISII